MNDAKWVRLSAMGGVVFVILIIVSQVALAGTMPNVTDTPAKIFSYFGTHQGNIKASAALYGLAMSAFLLWAPALFAALRKADGGRSGLALTALGGGILATAMTVTTAALEGATELRLQDLGPGGTRVFFTVAQFANGGILFGLLVLLGASAAVSLSTGLFGRWVGVLGGLFALGSVVGAFSISYAGLHSLQGVFLSLDTLWVLIVSVVMLRSPQDALAPPAATGRGVEAHTAVVR